MQWYRFLPCCALLLVLCFCSPLVSTVEAGAVVSASQCCNWRPLRSRNAPGQLLSDAPRFSTLQESSFPWAALIFAASLGAVGGVAWKWYDTHGGK